WPDDCGTRAGRTRPHRCRDAASNWRTRTTESFTGRARGCGLDSGGPQGARPGAEPQRAVQRHTAEPRRIVAMGPGALAPPRGAPGSRIGAAAADPAARRGDSGRKLERWQPAESRAGQMAGLTSTATGAGRTDAWRGRGGQIGDLRPHA